MSLAELRQLCVAPFPLSSVRPELMANLESIVEEIKKVGISGELWVDGSFLTKKVNPGDVDVVLHVREGQGFIAQDTEHVRIVRWISENLKGSHKCDSYCNVIPPVFHVMHAHAVAMKTYWEKQFGYSRGDIAKGIAVLSI